MNDERVGTAFYMAPEVFEGKAAGVRSDVYSLGVLAYEVVAGTRPFVADSYEALMVAHHTGVPKDLTSYRPELDPRIKRIVAKAMARDPEKRFASAREFVQAWSGVVGIEVEVRDTAQRPVTGRASRQRRDGDATEGARGEAGRAGPEDGAAAAGERREARRGGIFGWLRRNRG
jgi:serine/threonine-protein kinase